MPTLVTCNLVFYSKFIPAFTILQAFIQVIVNSAFLIQSTFLCVAVTTSCSQSSLLISVFVAQAPCTTKSCFCLLVHRANTSHQHHQHVTIGINHGHDHRHLAPSITTTATLLLTPKWPPTPPKRWQQQQEWWLPWQEQWGLETHCVSSPTRCVFFFNFKLQASTNYLFTIRSCPSLTWTTRPPTSLNDSLVSSSSSSPHLINYSYQQVI